jgi:hypothetical protein
VKKTVYEQGSGAASSVGWVATQLSSMNMHILRFADVLLLLAEAEVEGGTFDNARPLINQIRTRAGAAAQGPNGGPMVLNDIDSPLITWADYEVGTYDTPFASQAEAREAVRTERRIELAMEGERFFDLRRWGTAESVLNAYLASEVPRRPYLVGASTFASRHMLYPLPTTQIELSQVDGVETLTQNTGW